VTEIDFQVVIDLWRSNMFRKVLLIMALSFFLMGLATQVQAQRFKQREDNAPKVGEVAPTFKLKLLVKEGEEQEEFDLKSFIGKKPVLLIFGSYT
jgi:hypothetical protein